MQTIPFSELLPGHVVRVTDDNPPLIWAVDLVMAVTGKNRNNAGEILRDLDEKLFSHDRVVTKSQPGSGNSKTRLVSFQDALELVMVLPGKVAKDTRKKASAILTRYYAGDPSLVREIQANAQSNDGINVLARASMPEASNALVSESRKRTIEDLEIEERRAVIEERRAAVARTMKEVARMDMETAEMAKEKQIATKEKEMELERKKALMPLEFLKECYDAVARTGIEARDQVYYRSLFNSCANSASGGGQKQIEDGAVDSRVKSTVVQMVTRMKLSKGLTAADYKTMGKLASDKHMARHGKRPESKHDENSPDGGTWPINEYGVEDEDLLRDAITEHINKKSKVQATGSLPAYFRPSRASK